MNLLEKVIHDGLTPTCISILNIDGNVGVYSIPAILKMKIWSLESTSLLTTPKEKRKISKTVEAYKMLLDLFDRKVYINTPSGYKKIDIADIISGMLK